MFRFLGAVLAAGLLVPGALAQPLVSGKPAGVRKARMDSGREALMIGTGAAIMAGVGIVVSGGAMAGPSTQLQIQSQPMVSPTTTG